MDPNKLRVLQGVLSEVPFSAFATYPAKAHIPHTFNHTIQHLQELPITSQKYSGRCWIFAGLNMIRHLMAIKFANIPKTFKLSAVYLCKCDKIEKCNAALELLFHVITKANITIDSPEYLLIVDGCIEDGGTWGYFIDLVEKYGIIPNEAYPENHQSGHTYTLNTILRKIILQHGITPSTKRKQFEETKEAIMSKCRYIIEMFLGTTPTTFEWQNRPTTPLKYWQWVNNVCKLQSYVVISQFPTEPYQVKLKIQYAMNMVTPSTSFYKDTQNTYLNLSPKHFRQAVTKAIRKGTPVWFACDYGEYLLDKNSLLNTNASNMNTILGTTTPPKKEALKARVAGPNHAMVILGYNTPPGSSEPNRWKVENSHGTRGRHAGFLTMTQNYFDQFVITAVVPKSCLPSTVSKTPRSKWLPYYSVLGTVAGNARNHL
jgi:bleomycin hydrolase